MAVVTSSMPIKSVNGLEVMNKIFLFALLIIGLLEPVRAQSQGADLNQKNNAAIQYLFDTYGIQ